MAKASGKRPPTMLEALEANTKILRRETRRATDAAEPQLPTGFAAALEAAFSANLAVAKELNATLADAAKAMEEIGRRPFGGADIPFGPAQLGPDEQRSIAAAEEKFWTERLGGSKPNMLKGTAGPRIVCTTDPVILPTFPDNTCWPRDYVVGETVLIAAQHFTATEPLWQHGIVERSEWRSGHQRHLMVRPKDGPEGFKWIVEKAELVRKIT